MLTGFFLKKISKRGIFLNGVTYCSYYPLLSCSRFITGSLSNVNDENVYTGSSESDYENSYIVSEIVSEKKLQESIDENKVEEEAALSEKYNTVSTNEPRSEKLLTKTHARTVSGNISLSEQKDRMFTWTPQQGTDYINEIVHSLSHYTDLISHSAPSKSENTKLINSFLKDTSFNLKEYSISDILDTVHKSKLSRNEEFDSDTIPFHKVLPSISEILQLLKKAETTEEVFYIYHYIISKHPLFTDVLNGQGSRVGIIGGLTELLSDTTLQQNNTYNWDKQIELVPNMERRYQKYQENSNKETNLSLTSKSVRNYDSIIEVWFECVMLARRYGFYVTRLHISELVAAIRKNITVMFFSQSIGRHPIILLKTIERFQKLLQLCTEDNVTFDSLLLCRIIASITTCISYLDRQNYYRHSFPLDFTKKEGIVSDWVISHFRARDYDFAVKIASRFVKKIVIDYYGRHAVEVGGPNGIHTRPSFTFLIRLLDFLFACDNLSQSIAVIEESHRLGIGLPESSIAKMIQLASAFNHPEYLDLFYKYRVSNPLCRLSASDISRTLYFFARSGGGCACPHCGEQYNHRNVQLEVYEGFIHGNSYQRTYDDPVVDIANIVFSTRNVANTSQETRELQKQLLKERETTEMSCPLFRMAQVQHSEYEECASLGPLRDYEILENYHSKENEGQILMKNAAGQVTIPTLGMHIIPKSFIDVPQFRDYSHLAFNFLYYAEHKNIVRDISQPNEREVNGASEDGISHSLPAVSYQYYYSYSSIEWRAFLYSVLFLREPWQLKILEKRREKNASQDRRRESEQKEIDFVFKSEADNKRRAGENGKWRLNTIRNKLYPSMNNIKKEKDDLAEYVVALDIDAMRDGIRLANMLYKKFKVNVRYGSVLDVTKGLQLVKDSSDEETALMNPVVDIKESKIESIEEYSQRIKDEELLIVTNDSTFTPDNFDKVGFDKGLFEDFSANGGASKVLPHYHSFVWSSLSRRTKFLAAESEFRKHTCTVSDAYEDFDCSEKHKKGVNTITGKPTPPLTKPMIVTEIMVMKLYFRFLREHDNLLAFFMIYSWFYYGIGAYKFPCDARGVAYPLTNRNRRGEISPLLFDDLLISAYSIPNVYNYLRKLAVNFIMNRFVKQDLFMTPFAKRKIRKTMLETHRLIKKVRVDQIPSEILELNGYDLVYDSPSNDKKKEGGHNIKMILPPLPSIYATNSQAQSTKRQLVIDYDEDLSTVIIPRILNNYSSRKIGESVRYPSATDDDESHPAEQLYLYMFDDKALDRINQCRKEYEDGMPISCEDCFIPPREEWDENDQTNEIYGDTRGVIEWGKATSNKRIKPNALGLATHHNDETTMRLFLWAMRKMPRNVTASLGLGNYGASNVNRRDSVNDLLLMSSAPQNWPQF